MKAHRRVLSIFAMALAVALAFWIVPAVVDSGGQASAEQPFQLIYYDGHMHTTRSDGTGEVSDIVATAKARGLDAVIVTDHCEQLTLEEWESLVEETAAVSEDSFLALPGFENTGSEGTLNRDHILAYNVPDPFVGEDALELCPREVWLSDRNPYGTGPMNPGNLTKWVEYIHSQGGMAVHAHTSGSTQPGYDVDNLEVYNQSHVEDIAGEAAPLVGEDLAYQLALTINNFALYGDRDLYMLVPFPGIDDDGDGAVDEDPPNGIDDDGDTLVDEDGPTWMPLQYAIYLVTALFVEPYIGQWLGPPGQPLNSWDDLLMAYVDGTLDAPIFGVANSDAHNTLFLVDEDGDGQEGEDPIDGRDNDHDCRGDNSNGNRKPCDCLGGPGVDCDAGVDEDPPGHPLDSNVGLAKNGLYVKELTAEEVYKAIKAGRSFATTGPSLHLKVNGELMGDTAEISDGMATLDLSVSSESETAILVKIDIIKNGEVLQTIAPMSPVYEGTLVDTVTEDGYYRVEVISFDPATGALYFAYSNPVFVDVP